MEEIPGIALARCADQLGALAQRGAERRLMRAVAGQRRHNRPLHRHGRAQPPFGELRDGREHILQTIAAADRKPAGSPAWSQIPLRQSGQRDDRSVRIERRYRRDRAIERDILVNLVGDHRHVVLVCDLQQLASDRLRVCRARGIVRVVDHERLRSRGDESRDFAGIGLPAVGRIGAVKDLARADLVQDRRVQRIGRQRHQHFVAGIGERGENEINGFG